MTVASLLNEQQQQLATLLTSLTQERELLADAVPDGSALAETARLKAASFEKLQNLESKLAGLQQTLGLPEGLAGRRSIAQQEMCQLQLQQVLDTAGRGFRLNQLNGALVRSRLSWNERLLGFIRDAHDNWIYSPTGQVSAQRSTINSRA